MSEYIAYGCKEDDSTTFGSLSREFYYANLLLDETISENEREVRRLLGVPGARVDVVVPERGAAVLHVLAGMEAEDFALAVVRRALRRPRVDLDVRSDEGLTPAHVAATYGRCRILKLLLTKGADPSLVDYRLLLDAAGHAFKERQWQAYYMLTSYSALVDNGERFTKYLDHKTDQKTRSHATFDKDESISATCSGDLVNNHKNVDCDWLKKTLEVIPLDENSVSIIKNQIRKTETYQFPSDCTEESLKNCNNRNGSVVDKRFFNIQNLHDKLSSLRPLKPRQEEKAKNCDYTSEEPEDYRMTTGVSEGDGITFNSAQLGSDGTSEESIKDKKGSKLEGREEYFYGYAECKSSLKTRSSHNGVNLPVNESYSDNSKALNSNMLCKMSRIFLFMLKKRHINYQQL